MSNHLFAGLFAAGLEDMRACVALPSGRRLSRGDVRSASARYAAALAGLGVRPGDRVAVQVEKSLHALLLYLGCVRCGAVFLPLNTAYTRSELDYLVGDAEPSLLVGRPQDAEGLVSLAQTRGVRRFETLGAEGEGSLPRQVERQGGDWTDVERGPDDLAAILYTSGTTGRPKGAMLTHGNLRSNAEALVSAWRFSDSDRLIHALPLFHTHGLFVATNVALMAGARMFLLPRFDAAEVLSLLPKATVLMGVPTYYTRLLAEAGLSRESTSAMRLFISGSAPLLAETHHAFQTRTGHAILERYGMTETSMNTSNPYDGPRVAGSVGLPLPGVQIRIAEPEGGREVLDAGEVGMIEVRGPNVFPGYWRNPEKTREEFRPDGFFITGDLGRIDDSGYLWILGRGKDLVISGGYNVYPKEVELAIDALPSVMESSVIGVPHPDLGEAVVAVIVPEHDAAPDETALMAALRATLAGYKAPKRIVPVSELPRNAMGKVQKNLLRERFSKLFG